MAIETVDILVESDDIVPVPIDGVVVRVYDAAGAVFVTEGTTGAPAATGHVEFSLPGTAAPTPTEYQLRFYYLGASITSPQQIEVYSPPAGSPTGTNNFKAIATLLTDPVAVDPLLCRVSGYIRDASGRPKHGLDIHFIPEFNPLVAGDQGVLGERVAVRTDAQGYIELDLFRNGIYDATVESMENIQRQVCVPDRSSVNINHLLFPVVVKVEYSPAAPFALAVDGELILTPTITASDFRVLQGAGLDDVLYEMADSSIASVSVVDSDRISIRGLAAGATTLDVSRIDTSVVYVPDPGIDGGAATVTVT
jgi:hypothetical protein